MVLSMGKRFSWVPIPFCFSHTLVSEVLIPDLDVACIPGLLLLWPLRLWYIRPQLHPFAT